jgi:hypothetical protein
MREHGSMRRTMIASVLAGLLLAACGSTSSTSTAGTSPSASTNFALQVASTDLYAGTAQRVQVGVFGSTTEQGVQLLTGGSIPLSLVAADGGAPITGDAHYVPAPGTPSTSSPTLTPPSKARGVYQLDDVTFPGAGVWQAELSFTAGDQPVDLTASFTVAETPAYPAPGQPALKTANLTMADDANPQAIDSRAQDGAPVPDPELHQDTIASAIAAHRAALVLFATPVYCTSQFCGPTTDALQKLAKTGPSTADYIHIEIWNDFQKSVVNKAAGEWLLRNGDLTEPWLFLIGPDGTIVDRWGPLFEPAEVRAELVEVAG